MAKIGAMEIVKKYASAGTRFLSYESKKLAVLGELQHYDFVVQPKPYLDSVENCSRMRAYPHTGRTTINATTTTVPEISVEHVAAKQLNRRTRQSNCESRTEVDGLSVSGSLLQGTKLYYIVVRR